MTFLIAALRSPLHRIATPAHGQVTLLPTGHPITLTCLKDMGVSEDLAGYQARSGWLARIAQGAGL